jgi:benzil reductase ((S)-benzoin forming)
MKCILITGTSKGLGKALLDILATQDIFIISISRTAIPMIYNAEKFIHFAIDFSKHLTNELDLIENVIKEKSITEIFVISNAGIITPISQIGNLVAEEVYQNINVNLLSPILLINKIVAIHTIQKITILNISSGAANNALAGWSCYCTTKAAMLMFLKTLVEENKDNTRIAVFNINPGVMDTNMQEKIRATDKNNFPLVDKFTQYKENNTLKTPQIVAQEIVNQYFAL